MALPLQNKLVCRDTLSVDNRDPGDKAFLIIETFRFIQEGGRASALFFMKSRTTARPIGLRSTLIFHHITLSIRQLTCAHKSRFAATIATYASAVVHFRTFLWWSFPFFLSLSPHWHRGKYAKHVIHAYRCACVFTEVWCSRERMRNTTRAIESATKMCSHCIEN